MENEIKTKLIPRQLQNPEFRFCKTGLWNEWGLYKNFDGKAVVVEKKIVEPKDYDFYNSEKNWKPLGKKPWGANWQNKNYKISDTDFLKHIESKNFGIIGGYGNLRILDIDDIKTGEILEKELKTFAVKTGTGGKHFYFYSDYEENHRFRDEIGEMRSLNQMVICPSCQHPNGKFYEVINDYEIMEISPEDLYELIKDFIIDDNNSKNVEKKNLKTKFKKTKDKTRSGLEFRKIIALLRDGKTKEEIFETMGAYSKWVEGSEQYREHQFKKAKKFVDEEKEVRIEKTDKANKEFLESATEQKNPFKKLHYNTDHLQFFHEYNSLIGLYGRRYIPIIKARYYQLIGGIMQNKIKVGDLTTDTRLHIAFPLPTEGGKNDLLYANKNILCGIKKNNGDSFTISEPLSYSPESLIGKYVERLVDVGEKKKVRDRIMNLGHFANDFLEFDECMKLITGNSPEESQAREFISKAENPIGMNKVEKRLVDDLINETVAYCPSNTDSFFFQPFKKIPEEAILQGFMRRKIIPVGDVGSFLVDASEEIFKNKLNDLNFSRVDYTERIQEFLQELHRGFHEKEFLFNEESKNILSQYTFYLNAQAQLFSKKISNYARLTKYTSLQNLVKMSVIIACSFKTNIVNENHVALAYMDLVELMQNTFEFIDKQVLGEFDYGCEWQNSNFYQKECLKYLYNKKALSLETSEISIDEFLSEAIIPIFKIKETQARNRLKEMRDLGLIDSKQIGQHETKVWLKFTPNIQKITIEGDKGYKGYNTYNSIFLAKNDIFRGCHP